MPRRVWLVLFTSILGVAEMGMAITVHAEWLVQSEEKIFYTDDLMGSEKGVHDLTE